MVGKASLLLVLGFSLIFLVFGQRFGSLSNQAVDNMVDYYAATIAHECASTGAKMAANKIFLDKDWNIGFNNLSFNGGTINVTVQQGPILRVTSTGTFGDETYRNVILFQKGVFSRYAYYSTFENDGPGSYKIWWTPNDTVWGPFHTQDYFYAYRHPVFKGRVTTAKSLVLYDYYRDYPTQLPQDPQTRRQRRDYRESVNRDLPVFEGGYEPAVDIPLPPTGLQELEDAAEDNGYKLNGAATDTVYITFVRDSVKIKMGYNEPETEYKTSELAPNGVIYVEGMDIRLKGTVKGQYSVVSEENIYLDDNIVYNTDPVAHPNSDDLLGIIAQHEILITNNLANNLDGIDINAAIYSQEGGFGAEDYSTRPFSHYINLVGGITQYKRRAVGTFGSSSTGFYKRYRYDQRLFDRLAPPYYPSTQQFLVLSWLDERVND